MKKPPLLGKDPEGIRSLLKDSIAAESRPAESNSPSGRLLCDYLAESFPLGPLQLEHSSAIVNRLHSMTVSRLGTTVRELLTDPQTSVGLLRMVKEHYKEKEKRAKSNPERHAATVIYFAAIAHAVVFHGEKITEYSTDQLHTSLATLAKKTWITPQLEKLFSQALDQINRDKG